MSIIMGALGGLGEAVTDIAKSNRKFWDDKELQKQRAEIETNRQMALEKWKVTFGEERAEAARTAQVKRIDDAMVPLVQEARLAKLNKAYGTPNDGTDMSIKASDASEADLDRFGKLTESEKDSIRTKAAIKTGDINPKDAAVINQRGEADLTRLMLGDQRAQTMAQIAAGHDDTRKLVAGMMASAKRDGADKEDRVIVHQFLTQFDRKIQVNESEIKSLRAMTKDPLLPPEEKKSLQDQIAELQKANKNLTTAQYDYAKASGVKLPDSLTGANKKVDPNPNLPDMPIEKSALKAGTVYQTPRGPAKWNGKVFEAQ